MKQTEYNLSLREIVFLASLSGADKIYGVQDDTYLMSEVELKDEWSKIKRQLQTKKFIEVELDDSITINEDIEELIRGCCYPDVFIRFIEKRGGQRVCGRNLYVAGNGLVELIEDRLMKNNYVLRSASQIETVIDDIRGMFNIEGNFDEDSIEGTFTLEEYKKLLELIEEEHTKPALEYIMNIGFHLEAAEDLLYSISEKIMYVSIMSIRIVDENPNNTTGFSIIHGKRYLWILEIDETGGVARMTFKTCNSHTAVNEAERYILKLGG